MGMKVPPAMIDWLKGHFGLTGDLEQAKAQKLMSDALAMGELSGEKWAELVTMGQATVDERTEAKAILVEALGEMGIGAGRFASVEDFETALEARVQEQLSKGDLTMSQWQKAYGGSAARGINASAVMGQAALAESGSDGQRIRVKDCSESYRTSRATGIHVKTREPVTPAFMDGKAVETASEWDKCRSGVYLKYVARRSGLNVPWTEHDQAVMAHVVNEDPWCGLVGTEWKTGMRGAEVKALLDDGSGGLSGGIGINPIFFDTEIVTHPLLNGELLPFVEVNNVPRGAMVDGAAIGTPTVIWNNAEGTAQDLFDTSGLVNGWGKSIHPVGIYVEIGRDLMADSPVDIGQTLTAVIGERFAAELDKVIAIGNGSTQPEGIFHASSVNAINSTNGSGGPMVVADLENLSFGIGKQYRVPSWKPCFVCNDQDYRRGRAIPWGAGTAFTAQARALGSDYSAYKLLEWDCKIQNDIPQNSIAFGCLRKYRMYRRQGLEMRFVTDGQQLTQKNTVLLACRARYGGFVADPAAFAVMTDAPVHDGSYYTPTP